MIDPKPRWNDSTSSTVIGRSAGTVSSRLDSRVCRTRGSASSGSHCPTGSPSAIAPSSMSSIAATPAIGFVSEAMRKMASRPMGSSSPKALCPSAATCTSSPLATSATSPGRLPRATWAVSAASSASIPSGVSPADMSLLPSCGVRRLDGPPPPDSSVCAAAEPPALAAAGDDLAVGQQHLAALDDDPGPALDVPAVVDGVVGAGPHAGAVDGAALLRIPECQVGVGADRYDALARVEAEQPGRVR